MTAFTDLVEVTSERLGGTIVGCNDEFFAPASDLLKVPDAVWREGEYTDRGKWMDGWETRRRRTPGHDWCIIRLGVPARLHGVVVDTSYFRGNQPDRCSLEAAETTDDAALAGSAAWTPVMAETTLKPDTRHPIRLVHEGRATHIRFNIIPDGGVARLRVFGEPARNPGLESGVPANLAALENGALVVACSDMTFGKVQHLIYPGHSTHMGDGWETRRRRGPGHDWAVIRLAGPGVIVGVEVDTDHFKGNAPESFSLEACYAPGDSLRAPPEGPHWKVILPRTPLAPNDRARFDVTEQIPATHVRLGNYPDGGIARLRLTGIVT